jgi:hypothetical protein
MTYNEFIALSDGDQLTTVINSMSISVREQLGCTVLLHKVSNFYVELYYSMEETRVICMEAIESFTSLDPYWKQVDLSHLNSATN